MTFTSSVVSVIRHLNRQNQFSLRFKNVLIACDADPLGLCRWIQHRKRGTPLHSPTSRAVAKYFNTDKFPGGSTRELLSGNFSRPSSSLSTSNAVDDIQFIVLGAPEGGGVREKVDSSEPITHLPISLESLACLIQHTSRTRNIQRNASDAERMDLLQLPSGTRDIHPFLSECVKLLLPPRSVDLMIVDFPLRNLGSFIQDSLVVSSFLLSPDSSLLFVCSADSGDNNNSNVDASSSAADLKRFAKLKFRESYWRSVDGGTKYFYGTSTTVVGEVGRAVNRNDFPGFLPKGKRRSRRWNPYERHKYHKVKFIGSSFTEARNTKESLQNLLNRQQEEEDTLARKSKELFEVSFEMVEKQSFYSKRDD
ncbi:unnamed protein product [Phytomonas sp. Hart1]|nr:unnamed protein product [Phytomonas sp. Hart1]|eukprot:CCW71142.1 unnamed protein product [Phytomonas sp. isolate Hart1]